MSEITINVDLDELETEVKDAVDNALGDLDVSDLASNVDFSTKVQEAVDEADFSDALGDAMGHINMIPALLRALSSRVVQDRISEIVKEAVKPAKREITATLGETLPAFQPSPMGPGVQPRPYVSVDPDALLQTEDDEATEAFLLAREPK